VLLCLRLPDRCVGDLPTWSYENSVGTGGLVGVVLACRTTDAIVANMLQTHVGRNEQEQCRYVASLHVMHSIISPV
jgi:hypothetical protein